MSEQQEWTADKLATFYAAGELQEQQLCNAFNAALRQAYEDGHSDRKAMVIQQALEEKKGGEKQ